MRAQRDAWVVSGQLHPRGRAVLGFSESDVANAAVEAFYAALVTAADDRTAALAQLQEEFHASLVELGR